MKKLLMLPALLLFCLLAVTAWASRKNDSPVGIWTNNDKEARFEIYNCGNEQLCGKIIWLQEPNRDGKPKVDENNPDKSLQKRPIKGLVFLKGFKKTGHGKWDNGTIYDPKSGKTYSSYMKMMDNGQLEVKGYVGISLIGRSQIWSRVQ
jgi:uncharacterized protein (DUF2147 family)